MGDLGLLRSLLPTFKLCPMRGRVSPKSARSSSLNGCENLCGPNKTILSYRQRGLSAGKWPHMSNYGILRESLFIGKTKPVTPPMSATGCGVTCRIGRMAMIIDDTLGGCFSNQSSAWSFASAATSPMMRFLISDDRMLENARLRLLPSMVATNCVKSLSGDIASPSS